MLVAASAPVARPGAGRLLSSAAPPARPHPPCRSVHLLLFLPLRFSRTPFPCPVTFHRRTACPLPSGIQQPTPVDPNVGRAGLAAECRLGCLWQAVRRWNPIPRVFPPRVHCRSRIVSWSVETRLCIALALVVAALAGCGDGDAGVSLGGETCAGPELPAYTIEILRTVDVSCATAAAVSSKAAECYFGSPAGRCPDLDVGESRWACSFSVTGATGSGGRSKAVCLGPKGAEVAFTTMRRPRQT